MMTLLVWRMIMTIDNITMVLETSHMQRNDSSSREEKMHSKIGEWQKKKQRYDNSHLNRQCLFITRPPDPHKLCEQPYVNVTKFHKKNKKGMTTIVRHKLKEYMHHSGNY
mmetsp:Transcript_53179/g.129137  ORF Transcript_53179/g.129137 Transcript_53179/m.129137 type:complete len:110 (+) Transcript_53179:463-792(+)